ncbi:site-specific integrase [Deltaproteobacteria bacterium]|nr:site-specific integrase [Deltaproteobacteria bacterium]
MGQSLTIDEMKRILKKEIEKSKKHSSFYSYIGVDRSKELSKEVSLEELRKQEIELKSKKKTDFDDEVAILLEEEGIKDINRKSDSFRVFRENYIKIQSLTIKWKRELVKGETTSPFDLVSQILDSDLTPKTELQPIIENIHSPEPREPYLVETKSVEVKYNKVEKEKKISEVIDEFLVLRKGVVGEKLLSEYKVITDDFVEIIGNIPVSSLSKDSIRTYIKTQLKLPPNRRKNPIYRELDIENLLKLKEVKPQSRLYVNKFLTRLTTLMNFGVSQGYFKDNPILGMKIPIPKIQGRKKREPFSQEDLSKILTPKTFLDWTIDFGLKTKSDKPNPVKLSNAFYWTFLVGIMSGMRTNEIAQLLVEDIIKKDNVWLINVDETKDKSVKTSSSIRKVPVHPTLVSLGFLDYVKIIKSKGNDRVFPEITKTRDGYSSKISRHYNEKFLPTLGVWEKQVKGLYCSRHTFINRCYKKGVDRDIIKSVVGHEPDFTLEVYCGNPFTPKQLYQGISKVSYSNIKWNRLKVDWNKLIGTNDTWWEK